jgi:hypothetical protein
MIPDCNAGTLTEAYRLLAEVYQLLNEYAPVWYSADLRDQLQAALRPPERNTPLRVVVNGPLHKQSQQPSQMLTHKETERIPEKQVSLAPTMLYGILAPKPIKIRN